MATICARWCGTWWHVCYDWIYLYMLQKQLKTKKNKNAWLGMCNWSSVTWHSTGFTEHIAIGEKSYSSTNSIHNNVVMRQYGGHYKANNVPETLDQIIDILPCMHSELQLHPVKLKHKLEYKSHYMYDMICRVLCMAML